MFETCSLSKKASRNISEPTSLEDMNYEKVFEPEAALETRTGKIHKRTHVHVRDEDAFLDSNGF